ncbi:hypothetical protein Poli38472_011148 [Pythium oligandrum]|uniref:FHA domain-containing protein n=1 Tax=Pythium oligandrum TaxID=41045 RepID=A0A8K1FRF3_PYTOL|nr:hypothetical protein Poli38472_011148 [Pythium oligandrum]|eukprot:TMW67528.1 hypothetical protein Poli38472_011148 [Pythium oligandrum]
MPRRSDAKRPLQECQEELRPLMRTMPLDGATASRKRRIDECTPTSTMGTTPRLQAPYDFVVATRSSPPMYPEVDPEPPTTQRSPVLQEWSASALKDCEVVSRATHGSAFPSSSDAMPAFSSSMKPTRTNERDASVFGDDQGPSKRYRPSPFNAMNSNLFSSMTTSKSTGLREHPLATADSITPEEEFQALKEGSQNLMETLSISQQNTQEFTQTLDESPSTCIMRFVLHPDVDRALTAYQKSDLEKHGLYRIELHGSNSVVSLGRERYVPIFDKRTSGIDPVLLSRNHCLLSCHSIDGSSHNMAVFVTDKSRNGIRINGHKVKREEAVKLEHGHVITLLSSRQGSVLLGYVAEDPHVVAAQVPQEQRIDVSALVSRSQDSSQQPREVQELTLGVLFAAPLVGKDVHGKYHPIAELDIRREYTILQQSLVEASRYARRPVTGADGNGGSSSLYQYPHQINVCAKFANTDNFRMMVTIGCRALHFSGHGDERHLYFEDGMGLVHPIPHTSLRELFSAGCVGEPTVRLAFVSACSSAPLAHAFVSCGIPHVIGVKPNEKIEDFAAIEFTRSFYLALATGKSVIASFTIAQQSVAKSPNIRGSMEVAQKFLLLPENGDHSEIIFPLVTKQAESMADLGTVKLKRYPPLWFDDLPGICQGFCNRAVEVYKICLALMLNQSRITRLVTICGEAGIGKTAVAQAVANYVGPRITSQAGVKIFSVETLEREDREDHAELVRKGASVVGIKSQVMTRLKSMVTEYLANHKPRFVFNSFKTLLVFDGCDVFLLSDQRRERFRAFISDLLTNNSSLKIVVTARSSLTADGAVAGQGERVYALSRFNAKMAAKMLLGLMSRPIRLDEVKRARMNGSTTDKLELISSHPALLATLGIPKRIADLAGRLNQVAMDDIPVDESAIEMMEA